MKKIIALASLAVLAASCSNDEDIALSGNQKDLPVTIQSVGIADLQTSRAILNNTLTGAGATLGLYVDGDNDNYKANHELYTFGDDKWTFTSTEIDPKQLFYKGGTIKYIAYSPYAIGENALHSSQTFTLPYDGNYGEGVTAVSGCSYDLLWSKGSSESEKLQVELSHVLTMITVNFKYANTIDPNSKVKDVVISNTIPTGTLKLVDASDAAAVVTIPTENTVATAALTPLKLSTANFRDKDDESKGRYAASYEALIIPQTVSAFKISIKTTDGRIYSKTLDNKTFESGYAYTINLQIGENVVEMGTIEAKEWNTAPGGVEFATE